MQKNEKNDIKKYVFYFYIYAFLGWLVDVAICFISDGVLEKRGFLYGTLCPMYGVAAIVLVFISKKIKADDGYLKRFIISFFWCSVLEYLTSLVLEIFFGIRWWDYSKEPLNIQGRICLAASVFWGILSVVFMKIIHPFIERNLQKILKKFKEQNTNILAITLICITAIDTVLSIIKYVIRF